MNVNLENLASDEPPWLNPLVLDCQNRGSLFQIGWSGSTGFWPSQLSQPQKGSRPTLLMSATLLHLPIHALGPARKAEDSRSIVRWHWKPIAWLRLTYHLHPSIHCSSCSLTHSFAACTFICCTHLLCLNSFDAALYFMNRITCWSVALPK